MDVGTAEKKVKAENANWCILTLFETIFFFYSELPRKKKRNKGALWCILTQFELMFWKLELLRKI